MTMKNTVRMCATLALAAGLLAGCGTTAAPTATGAKAAAIAAQGKKDDAKRPAPPAAAKAGPVKQGFAARESARIADRSLAEYNQLLRDWERAYSDAEKDRVEQRMLNELHGALEEVQSVTSAQGVDAQDRRAYDIADGGLNLYDRLYRDWASAWTSATKRRIINDMLTGMVRTLQDIQRV